MVASVIKMKQNSKGPEIMIQNPRTNQTNNYLFKVINRNTRKRCEICSKLTIKHQHDVVVFLLLTLNIFYTFL